MATNVDFLQRLRLRNLLQANPEAPKFGGQNPTGLFNVPEVDSSIPLNAPDVGLASLRNKRSPFLDQYRDLLAKAPTRQDYQHGKVGKALALAAGAIEGGLSKSPGRGIAIGRDILDQPYNRALEDYSTKGGRFRELADLEYRDLGDEVKLETAISAEDIRRRKQIIDEAQAASGITLNDARAKELENRMRTQGKSLQRNEVSGALELVDMVNGTRMSLGQFLQTPEGKAELAHKFFVKGEEVRQTGRKELQKAGFANAAERQQAGFAHDAVMAGVRFKNDKELVKFKKETEDKTVNPTQDNAAFNGAYEEILTEFPEMRAILFKLDEKTGEWALKTDKQGNPMNKEAYQMFMENVKNRKNIKLGKPSTGFTGEVPSGTTDATGTPTVTPPEQEALRQTALKFLRDNNFEEDEESIQEAMKQIGGAAQSTTPTNQGPLTAPDAYPTVNVPGNAPMPFAGLFNAPNYNQPMPPGAFNIPEAYPPQYNQPSRTQRELRNRGVTGSRFR